MASKKKPAERKRPPRNGEGRPKTLLSDLPVGWQETALKIYTDGGTDVEVRAAVAPEGSIVMSDDLFYRLIEEEPEFSRIVKSGRALAEVWHQKQGRAGCWGGKAFNAGVYGLIMKNRFGWSEKQEQKTEMTGNLTVCTGIEAPPNAKPGS